MVTWMGATTRVGTVGARALLWLLWALTGLALLSALPAHAQGLPTATLVNFSHTQQSAGATEQETRTVTVPPMGITAIEVSARVSESRGAARYRGL